jgi:Zn-dependent protease
VILLEPGRTGYDLNFRLFGVPVRVHPFFWLVTLLLNFRSIDQGRLDLLAVWVACVFVSILVHEFGHILAGQLFGRHGSVVLYIFGGLAVGSSDVPRRWQRIFVSFAGPLAGFILLGIVIGISYAAREQLTSEIAWIALAYLFEINLWWGLMNLLPIYPLDGGQISVEVFQGFSRRNGLRMAIQLSIAVAVLVAIAAVMAKLGKAFIPWIPGDWYIAILFGMLAYSNYQLLQQLPRDAGDYYEEREYSDRAPWESDPDEWKRR